MEDKRIKKDTAFIATVYNEADTIGPFLESLAAQSRLPEEIVIVDGGSTDGTWEIIQSFFAQNSLPSKLNIIQRVAGIAEGRNIAIKSTGCRLICISDAGCIMDSGWLETITTQSGEDIITGGYSAALASSFLERCLAAAVVVLPHEIKEDKFMPSSRNLCLYRDAWQKVGGYPEYLDFGEDMKFNFHLRDAGYKVKFVPKAVVHWRMRSSLGSIFKQFFRYAKGDAWGRMYTHRHLVRIAAAVLFIVLLALAFTLSSWVLLALLLLLAAYSWPALLRVPYVFRGRHRGKKLAALFTLPFLLAYIDLAKLCGYLYGLARRPKP